MKLRYSFKWALFLSYVLIALVLYFFVRQIRGEIRPLYLESVEEVLVDEANLLASWFETQIGLESFESKNLQKDFDQVFQRLKQRRPRAFIYRKLKNQIDTEVYITNADGIVIYDSEGSAVGQDYSQWRDVSLTLRGYYGARSSLQDFDNPNSSNILHVAAPIRQAGKVVGVVTVRKPTSGLLTYIDNAKERLVWFGLVLVGLVLLLGILASRLFSRPLVRLTNYARKVRDGKKAVLPKFRQTEVREVALAFDQMRKSLEGKKYVEHYVQNLTHELKTPLTSLLGAVELLQENEKVVSSKSQEIQERLLKNIESESQRLQRIVERMLDLSSLEARDRLEKVETICLNTLSKKVIADLKDQTQVQVKNLFWEVSETSLSPIKVEGDPFLLEAALRNVIQNAIEFSPQGGSIGISLEVAGSQLALCVNDQGPGIPNYAVEKVWEKFYSLPRPDTGRKSSGLGLSFVQQVMKLHRGSVTLKNLVPSGVQVCFIFALKTD